MIRPEGSYHDRISPDPDFRHPSRPPPAQAHRQFRPGQRAHRHHPPRSRRQQRRPRLRRADQPDDLEFAKALHDALPVACRYLPGNHDIGDNPTAVGPVPPQPVSENDRQTFIAAFGDDRWRFDAAGWCFIGLNSLVMNSGLASEAEQFDWLASELAGANGKPVALFLHKPLFLNTPEDPGTGGERDPLRADAGAAAPGRHAAAPSICG